MGGGSQPPGLACWERFRPEELLGEGATSLVWRATDLSSGESVALKVARRADADGILAGEAERLATLVSPHVPELVDAGRVGSTGPRELRDRVCLALTWAEGRSLDQLGPLAPDERIAVGLALARDIGGALRDLHALGITHGDVKPANIRLAPDEPGGVRAKLLDLGLSGDSNDRALRGGTPRYLPPEVWAGADEGDGRARDRFALGLVLAEIVRPELQTQEDLGERARSVPLPAPFDLWCRSLLAPAPGARPRAGWIAARAGARCRALPDTERARHRALAVQAAYLASRRGEIDRACKAGVPTVQVEGAPGTWLGRASALCAAAHRLRGLTDAGGLGVLADADARARQRWMVNLVGAAAARWPVAGLAEADDRAWAEALLSQAATYDLATLSFSSLSRALAGGPAHPSGAATRQAHAPTPVEVALWLSAPETRGLAIERVEAGDEVPVVVRRAAADALRRMGESGRAFALLADDDDPAAASLRAEVARRAGDRVSAEREARRALAANPNDDDALAILARLRVDAGRPDEALGLLSAVERTARTAEVAALAKSARGDRAGAERELAFAESLARSEEARGRAAGLSGFVAHQAGDSAKALAAFRRASEHAERAGALVEEATYLTGEASAAVDEGKIEWGLCAARKAVLLWEHLGRAREAARALLAEAAALATAGAGTEALSTAEEARERARSGRDPRADAYAWLVTADALFLQGRDAAPAARAASALLESLPLEDDRLRAAARLLRATNPGNLEPGFVAHWDEHASTEDTVAAARLDWWGARAESWLAGRGEGRRELPVKELCLLVGRSAALSSRGPAFAAGAALAARTGDGDAARVLTQAQAQATRDLLSSVPDDLRGASLELAWVKSATAVEAPEITPQQIAQFEALARALGARDEIRPLLDQVVDVLVLWTGVERGFLLLPAPGGKLQPRAGRNLSKADLRGDELVLSQSLAQRALALREPVVAVDAAGDMPSLHASVHALKLRSVLAVPLIAKGEPVGVVYLDDRVRRGAFGPKELAWVRLVASIAALAIAGARDQLLLRRSARRAERARRALAQELSRREAELDALGRELARARDASGTRFRYDAIIGRSAPMIEMLRLVDRVTLSNIPVLLLGESGSGKELVARAIHANGTRKEQVFVTENCAAIPEPLLESTLFGHARGAFTGADRARAGLFEIAHRGTLFLDEVAEMSLAMQSKLLRVLQDGEVHPLGAERGRKVDVRIIAATHRDLDQMVREGRFRQDLLYRLRVIALRVPPLRERRDDIPLLVRHFLDKHGGEAPPRVSVDAVARLSAYDWPGNVRQLENEVRRAIVLCDGLIERAHLSTEVQAPTSGSRAHEDQSMRARVDALELELVEAALAKTAGNQTRAAEMLGLSRFGLQKMIKRLGVRSVER